MRGGIYLFSSLSYSFSAILARFIVLFFAITVHEFSHGYTAYKLGDPTAKYSGRLSLNPLAHLDPIGALCMLCSVSAGQSPCRLTRCTSATVSATRR